jgi:hypothetical protein
MSCTHPEIELQWGCETCGHRRSAGDEFDSIIAGIAAERARIRDLIAALRDPDAGNGFELPDDEVHLLRADVMDILEETT